MWQKLQRWWNRQWCASHGHIYPPKLGLPDSALARTLKAGDSWADMSKPCQRCGVTVASAPKAV